MAGMNGIEEHPGASSRSGGHRGGRWAFVRRFLVEPNVVGALWPSSRYLARALMEPFKQRCGPASVLEVGAGTGAVTRHLGRELGPADRLDVCEILPDLADHLDALLSRSPFEAARREGRVSLFRGPMQALDRSRRYDYVISGLPFTALEPSEVLSALEVIRAVLKPGGVFAYFEYVALRRLRVLGSVGRARRKVASVSAILDDHIRRFEVGRKTVFANMPPAHTRYWRFEASRGRRLPEHSEREGPSIVDSGVARS